jgi:hypothetical protein
MAYYPKNKIKTHQYTDGGEYYFFGTTSEYKGNYFRLYNGRYFTGNYPNDGRNEELTVISRNGGEIPSDFTPLDLGNVKTSPFLPTPKDYEVGAFTRYFVVRRNQFTYYEVTKDEYTKYIRQDDSVSWVSNKPFSLNWTLKGDKNTVAQINKNMVEMTEMKEELYGFKFFLKEDYTQYHQSALPSPPPESLSSQSDPNSVFLSPSLTFPSSQYNSEI